MHIIYRLLLIFQAGTLPETNQQFLPLKLGPKKIAPISEKRLNSSSPTIHFSGAKNLLFVSGRPSSPSQALGNPGRFSPGRREPQDLPQQRSDLMVEPTCQTPGVFVRVNQPIHIWQMVG